MNPANKDNSRLTVKEVYQEIGANYRQFLGWRHSILALYATSMAALGTGLVWLYQAEEGQCLLWVVGFLAGLLLTAALYIIDDRNRELCRICLQSGQACEQDLPVDIRIYTRLSCEPHRQERTHTWVVTWLCRIVSVTMFFGLFWALWAWWWGCLGRCTLKAF